MIRYVAALFVAVAALVGCSSETSSPTAGVATSSAPPEVIHSTLIDLALPLGTKISSHAEGVEIWQPPGTQAETVADLKPKLPIGKELAGLKWCSDTTDAKTGTVEWRWSGPGGSIDITVLSNAELTIEKSATPAAGCA
ncbi:MAG: hypothetical protein ABWY93_08540 [Mycobacterium sp.]